MPSCGSQCVLCDLPVNFDTYKGCSHGCRYCFTQRKRNNDIIKTGETHNALRNFINGKRNELTKWVDWDIPIHFGGLSDPFQPCEKERRNTYKSLEVFAETQYPVVISTKGRLCVDDEYLKLLSECNVVMQVSMVCDEYDAMEKGCPSFAERLRIVETLSKSVQRVNIRVQPYMCEVYQSVKRKIKDFANVGAYGAIFEGMKFFKKKHGLIKLGADYVYPASALRKDFIGLREECHANGLKFYSGENRLRTMGDSMTCCGVDGVDGFRPNSFNLCNIVNSNVTEPTDGQKADKSGGCFMGIHQSVVGTRFAKENSFADNMLYEYKTNRRHYDAMFGIIDQ